MCDDVLGWWRDVVRNESLEGQRGDEWMDRLDDRLGDLSGPDERKQVQSQEVENQQHGREPEHERPE